MKQTKEEFVADWKAHMKRKRILLQEERNALFGRRETIALKKKKRRQR